MKDDCALLNHIRQTTEMGINGIDSVMDYTDGTMREALIQQRTEYADMHKTADELLKQHNGTPENVGVFAKWSSELSSGMKTMMDSSQSNIADMMIQGNTMGVTKSLQTIRDYNGSDHAVMKLAHKLLDTENANIEQMKHFL